MSSAAHSVLGTSGQQCMDFLFVVSRGLGTMYRNGQTVDVVRQFKRRNTILNVNVKYIIVLFALIELLATGTNGINNLADFGPAGAPTIPL